MRFLVVENSAVDPIARLGDWLTEAQVATTIVRPYAGEDVGELAGYDGLVVLGGEMSATDDATYPWLRSVKGLLRSAVSDGLPTLAICLGAQLLADALGGFVEESLEGPELGAGLIAKRDDAMDDPVFGALPMLPDVLSWHYDAVTELPPGATLLASSPRCGNQAFRVGSCAWGLQFHIETTPEMVADWARRDELADRGADVDTLLRRADAIHPQLEETWKPVVTRFVRTAATLRERRGP